MTHYLDLEFEFPTKWGSTVGRGDVTQRTVWGNGTHSEVPSSPNYLMFQFPRLYSFQLKLRKTHLIPLREQRSRTKRIDILPLVLWTSWPSNPSSLYRLSRMWTNLKYFRYIYRYHQQSFTILKSYRDFSWHGSFHGLVPTERRTRTSVLYLPHQTAWTASSRNGT